MQQREKLEKTLKPHWVWAIAFGSAIGWGAFVLPVDWIGIAGPMGVIIGYSIGALLMIIIGVCYGYLIERLPVSGGEFVYAYYGLGRYHAFLCGWFLTLGYMSIVALNASALALLGKFIMPSVVEIGHLYTIAGWDVYAGEIILACTALVIFAFINVRGASLSGLAQFIFCLCLIAGIVLLSAAMFLHPSSSPENLQPLFKPGTPALASILSIVAIAPWAYVGFGNIPQAAEEFNFHPRKSFSLIVLAMLCAGIAYSLVIIATGVGTPWVSAVNAGEVWGTGAIVESAYGKAGVMLLGFALLMGVATGLNGFYVSTSRLLFSMGRAKILPGVFAKLHPKFKTPHAGIFFTMVFTLFAPFFGRQALLWVVDMAALGVTIAYFYACFVAYRLFSWSKETAKEKTIAAPWRKGFSLIGIMCSVSFFLLLVVPGSPGFLSTPSWVALLIWVILGAIFFLARYKSYSAIPKEELDEFILGEHKNKKHEEGEKKSEDSIAAAKTSRVHA